jgi:rubrerythrin
MIAKVEKEHEERYKKLADNIEKAEVFKKNTKVRWKCRNCGYVSENDAAPEKCPACLHPKAYFEIKETNY